MIFSRRAILSAIERGWLTIVPFESASVQSAHIDLHFGGSEEVEIAPGGFLLAKTAETITLSEELCGFMEGRAGLAKLGLSVEQSSTFVEPGTDSQMTLELFNASSETVKLAPGQPIAKLFVTRVVQEL